MAHRQPAITGAAEPGPGRNVPHPVTEPHVLGAARALADAGIGPDEKGSTP